MRTVARYVVLGGLGLGCACIGWAYPTQAVNRAAREFSCPHERIAVVQRADIADNVYDLNVCGAMVRYSCISGENTPVQCTREPPPQRWDIDPAVVAALARPPGVPANLTPAVCDRYALGNCVPCFERYGASWRWHQCADGAGPTGAQP